MTAKNKMTQLHPNFATGNAAFEMMMSQMAFFLITVLLHVPRILEKGPTRQY
jgi:hypothetical protein